MNHDCAALIIRIMAESDCESLDGHLPAWDRVVDKWINEDDDEAEDAREAIFALGDARAREIYEEHWAQLVPDQVSR